MRYLSLLLFLFLSLSAKTQDLIVFNTGDTLTCKIVSVAPDKLYTDNQMDYEKTRINSYYINERWIQLGGPVAIGQGRVSDGIDHRFEFEQSLSAAGGWLTWGVVFSTVFTGLGVLIDDNSVSTALFVAASVTLPVSSITAGAKLHKASEHHAKIKLD